MTNSFYDKNAETFASATHSLDMSHLYEPFLARLPAGAHILDAGCGSGRDTRAFLDMGYQVTAIDASPALVSIAKNNTGLPVQILTFQEMTFTDKFDGIWACASLLHVPESEIRSVLKKFANAAHPSGILYASMKWGTGERWHDERLFVDYTDEIITALFAEPLGWQLDRCWQSTDIRPGRSGDAWLNLHATCNTTP